MLATYFDVFFYMANWGTRRLAIKLPRTALSKATIDAYTCDSIEYHRHNDDVIVDIMSPEEDYLEEYWTYEDALDDLVGLREQLLAGDHRALFMIWLDEAVRSPRSRAARRTAPAIPDGLGTLSPSLNMLAKIFTLDRDLIDAAASANPARSRDRQGRALASAIEGLSSAHKDKLLIRAASGDATVRAELLALAAPEQTSAQPADVEALRHHALHVRSERQRVEEARRARERQEEEERLAAARAVHLEHLAASWEESWEQVYDWIDEGNRKHYKLAAALIADLQDAARNQARAQDALGRLAELREEFSRRSALMQELDRQELP